MSDLNEALMFVTVVEKGSFTAAARALGVPKATLSRKVQALEERLGAMLLKRTTRRLGLTESGQVYYAHCAQVPRVLEDAEAAVIQLAGTPRGWLRVTAPYTLGAQVIVPLVPEFMARYPDVRIDMHLSNEIVDLVASDLDLALRVGTLADSSLVAHLLGRFSSHVYASPDYLARYGEPLLPPDLVHHRALALTRHRHHGRFTWALSDGRRSEELAISPVLVMNEPSALRNAALAGLGLALLPDRLAAPHEDDGTLLRMLPVWSAPEAELNAVFPRDRVLPPKVRAFIDFLVERLSFPPVGAGTLHGVVCVFAFLLWTCGASFAQAQAWLPGDDAIGAAAGEQVRPAIARGGNLLLTAWSDRRSYPPDASSFFDFETSADIYAMRLDAAGNPLARTEPEPRVHERRPLRRDAHHSQGVATFNISGPHGTWTLTVQDVAHPPMVFDPNHSVLEKSITF